MKYVILKLKLIIVKIGTFKYVTIFITINYQSASLKTIIRTEDMILERKKNDFILMSTYGDKKLKKNQQFGRSSKKTALSIPLKSWCGTDSTRDECT